MEDEEENEETHTRKKRKIMMNEGNEDTQIQGRKVDNSEMKTKKYRNYKKT